MVNAKPVSRRRAWAEAVWSSPSLHPMARLVALCYVDHVADDDPCCLQVWVTHERLMERCGVARNTVTTARRELIREGWLTQTKPASGRRAARFGLTVPAHAWVAADATQGNGSAGRWVAADATQESDCVAVFETQDDKLNRTAGLVESQSNPVESQSDPRSVAVTATDFGTSGTTRAGAGARDVLVPTDFRARFAQARAQRQAVAQ